jgi:hypothetical protein
MRETSGQDPHVVIHEKTLDSLNALPAGIHIVSYAKQFGCPYPQNLWANCTYLEILAGLSFEEFLLQVEWFT